jgi:hypothetical protein
MPTGVRFLAKLPLNHTFRLKLACGFRLFSRNPPHRDAGWRAVFGFFSGIHHTAMPTSVRFFAKLSLNHTFRLKLACGFLQKVAFSALHPDLES